MKRLLVHLGYRESPRGFEHKTRTVIFLGDFIDRGDQLKEHKELLSIVIKMVRSGNAHAVMGNHEFNALSYHTNVNGQPLRAHSAKNRKQHKAFLQEFENDPQAKSEVLDFFYTLPLWLEFNEFRVVHACWDQSAVDYLTETNDGAEMTTGLLKKANDVSTKEYKCVETLLKGYEIALPNKISFSDKDGHLRHAVRSQWWKPDAQTLSEVALPPDLELGAAGELPIPAGIPFYPREARPCFIGHYWLKGTPSPLSGNVACLDYSVAKGGKLVAFRWDKDLKLTATRFEYADKVKDSS